MKGWRLFYGTSEVAPVLCLLAACQLLPSAYGLPPMGGLYEVREIKPHVFVWVPDDILDLDSDPQFSRAGTAGFIITPDAVVVVDTTNSPVHARELLYEIRKRTGAPVKVVINTGAHGDYMLGNEVFVDQQASIISTVVAQAEMGQYRQALTRRLEDDFRLQTRMRGIHVTVSNQTFDGEMALHIGGQEIRLLTFSSRPQTGDIAVYLPETKILFLGDLYQNSYFPRIGSRDVRRWIEILRQVENWDAATYVPGHGAPGDKKQLAEFRRFLEWLGTEVGARIRQGKSLSQIQRELTPSESYHWHAPELAPSGVEAVYQQLVGARPSAP